MANRTKKAKLRFYQIPGDEDMVAFLGSEGIQAYGVNKKGFPDSNNHYHNLLEIGICRFGEGSISFENRGFSYGEGTVVIIPANYPHQIRSAPGEKSFWEFIYINPGEFLGHFYEKRMVERFLDRINQAPVKRQQEEIPLFVRELDCLMDQVRIQDWGYKNCIRGLVFTLLMEIAKIQSMREVSETPAETANQNKLSRLKRAIAYVEDHYAEEIRISDIAKAAYISESYLRRIFADNYNMSPLQYVNLIRIHVACKILQTEAYNINEVARRVGFDNMSTFIKNFKKITGKTPKQWAMDMKWNGGENVMSAKHAQKSK